MSSKQQIFSPFVDNFLSDRISKGRSPRTVKSYHDELSLFFRWLDPKINVEDLTPNILRDWFISLSKHRNQGGIHGNFRVLKSFLLFTWEENDLLSKNPIRKVKIPAAKLNPLPEIPIEDIKKLILACEHSRLKLRDIAILKVLTDSGLRASELLALNIGDISKSGTIKVLHGKGDKFRVSFLGKSALKALNDYLETRQDLSPDNPMFLNELGERLHFFGLRQLIKRLGDRAGIKSSGSIHCFRRTFALVLYRKGTPILEISRLLGHTSIEVTKRYLNIGNEDLQQAHQRNSPADLL